MEQSEFAFLGKFINTFRKILRIYIHYFMKKSYRSRVLLLWTWLRVCWMRPFRWCLQSLQQEPRTTNQGNPVDRCVSCDDETTPEWMEVEFIHRLDKQGWIVPSITLLDFFWFINTKGCGVIPIWINLFSLNMWRHLFKKYHLVKRHRGTSWDIVCIERN